MNVTLAETGDYVDFIDYHPADGHRFGLRLTLSTPVESVDEIDPFIVESAERALDAYLRNNPEGETT